MQGVVPSPLFSLWVVHSLGVVACCSDCSYIHNSDSPGCFDYYANFGLDSGSDSCCSHTDSVTLQIIP